MNTPATDPSVLPDVLPGRKPHSGSGELIQAKAAVPGEAGDKPTARAAFSCGASAPNQLLL